MALLEIKNLHAFYGHVHALKGIHLRVEQGEIVTLIGANGAGKTTTLRSVSGLLSPRQGQIIFDSEIINDVPAHQIVYRGISQSPEGRKIFSALTVQENLNMGAYSLGSDKAAIEENRRRVFRLFPRLEEPDRRHLVRRRAADASYRAGTDGSAQAFDVGRAIVGPGADVGRGDF
jgi:branched-chain amino acid transport system ATP-binding protein